MDSTLYQKLKKIWLDPKNPAAFGGIRKLIEGAKQKNITLTYKEARQFLHSLPLYVKTRFVRQKFRKRRKACAG